VTEQSDAESDAENTVPPADHTVPEAAHTVSNAKYTDSGAANDDAADAASDEGEEIPVVEVAPVTTRPAARPPAPVAPGADWTRTEPVRDDPGTLGEEARKLWDSVREQFVDPLVRNYPEAAGHLTTAGTELAAALRALVRGAEQRWTSGGEERPDDGRDSPQDKRP